MAEDTETVAGANGSPAAAKAGTVAHQQAAGTTGKRLAPSAGQCCRSVPCRNSRYPRLLSSFLLRCTSSRKKTSMVPGTPPAKAGAAAASHARVVHARHSRRGTLRTIGGPWMQNKNHPGRIKRVNRWRDKGEKQERGQEKTAAAAATAKRPPRAPHLCGPGAPGWCDP